MTFRVDASAVFDFGAHMERAPEITQRELVTTTNALAAVGVGLAQDYAPVDEGTLKAGITITEQASVGNITARYGVPGVVYARMREFGGTITARNAPYLVFQTRDGSWVKVKSVKQKGTRYMGRSAAALFPRARGAYLAALGRILIRVGG